jgi:hypothetical protein
MPRARRLPAEAKDDRVGGLDIAPDRRATERMAEHVRRQREAAGLAPRAARRHRGGAAREETAATAERRANPRRCSATTAPASTSTRRGRTARPAPAARLRRLAERAAAIQAAHLAANRKTLTVQSFAVVERTGRKARAHN